MGPHCNTPCCDIASMNEWVESQKYVVFTLSVSYDNAKSSSYHAFNSICSQIRSEETILQQQTTSVCMPCLLYALEACRINTSREKSLFTRVVMKCFVLNRLMFNSVDCTLITDVTSRVVHCHEYGE